MYICNIYKSDYSLMRTILFEVFFKLDISKRYTYITIGKKSKYFFQCCNLSLYCAESKLIFYLLFFKR